MEPDQGDFLPRDREDVRVVTKPGETARKGYLATKILGASHSDDEDLRKHIDYVHFNPVKHGLVTRTMDWPYSSFHRFVKQGHLPADWGIAVAVNGKQFGE